MKSFLSEGGITNGSNKWNLINLSSFIYCWSETNETKFNYNYVYCKARARKKSWFL